ncbi:hypothetical protein [Saccharothrix obliqua]|nr:hypothetical protein [Saccharothrix obliqua]
MSVLGIGDLVALLASARYVPRVWGFFTGAYSHGREPGSGWGG